MGRSFFCFRQFSSPRRLPKQDSNDDRSISLTTSIVEFMKPSCLWREKSMMWKRLVQQPKRQKKQQKVKMVKELTLEEWFSTSSPCRDESAEHNTWVFPSSHGDNDDDAKFNSRHSFSQQRLLIEVVDCGRRRSDVSCLSSRKSSKVKKRVSFRLPEEADIFIFCSPNADSEE